MKKIISIVLALVFILSCVCLTSCEEKELTAKELVDTLESQFEKYNQTLSNDAPASIKLNSFNTYDIGFALNDINISDAIEFSSIGANAKVTKTESNGFCSDINLFVEDESIDAYVEYVSNVLKVMVPNASESFLQQEFDTSENIDIKETIKSVLFVEDKLVSSKETITIQNTEVKDAKKVSIDITKEDVEKIASELKLTDEYSDIIKDFLDTTSNIQLNLWFAKNKIVKATFDLDIKEDEETGHLSASFDIIVSTGKMDITGSIKATFGDASLEIPYSCSQSFENGTAKESFKLSVTASGDEEIEAVNGLALEANLEGTYTSTDINLSGKMSVSFQSISISIPTTLKLTSTQEKASIEFSLNVNVPSTLSGKININIDATNGNVATAKTLDDKKAISMEDLQNGSEEAQSFLTEILAYAAEKCPNTAALISGLFMTDDTDYDYDDYDGFYFDPDDSSDTFYKVPL